MPTKRLPTVKRTRLNYPLNRQCLTRQTFSLFTRGLRDEIEGTLHLSSGAGLKIFPAGTVNFIIPKYAVESWKKLEKILAFLNNSFV